MSSRQKAKLAFAAGGILLVLSGAVSYLTVTHLLESERSVIHSFEVEAALGDTDSAIARAGRLRAAYIFTVNKASPDAFEAAAVEVHQQVDHLRAMTADNPAQRELGLRLEDATQRRLELLRNSIQLQNSAPQNHKGQGEITNQSVTFASETTTIIQAMRTEEHQLLQERVAVARRWFNLAIITISGTFTLALVLFAIHYRLLISELNARERAEQAARKSEESLRRLTVRLLRLQDEERRKISRELHDSLGQYLASVKMNLDLFSQTNPPDKLLQEATHLLEQSIAETRMISHLLHPPLLDETGLASAARWYVDGFARRSGIEVSLDIPGDMERLPEPLELGLFRVLQESLTNIHRHSKSSKAEIALQEFSDRVLLTIKDHGNGIPAELLHGFSTNGTRSGVGLAGMRERIHELGGRFDIHSNTNGTQITVTMPLPKKAKASDAAASV